MKWPQRHITLIREFWRKEPPVSDRIGFLLAQVASTVISSSIAGASSKVKPTDLDPWYDAWNKEDSKKAEADEMNWLGGALK